MSSDSEYILKTLKTLDPERYLAVLYLPQEVRSDIASLWLFDAEISRIPDIVSEPTLGEIRLQWWRDLVKSGDNAGSGPLARSLVSVIDRHNLPREVFNACLDARAFDLYHDPMPDMGSFEGYLGETSSSLFQMAALCAGAERSTELADACGHAGMAFGMSRLLVHIAKHRSQGKLFFPSGVLDAQSISRNEWFENPVGDKHLQILADLIDLADSHLRSADAAIRVLPVGVRPVFLVLCLVRPMLKIARREGNRILTAPPVISPLKQYLRLMRAAISGRIY
ncbi:MAG: phytoene/squalene synthase family protein [Pseudomonadota bacterium]